MAMDADKTVLWEYQVCQDGLQHIKCHPSPVSQVAKSRDQIRPQEVLLKSQEMRGTQPHPPGGSPKKITTLCFLGVTVSVWRTRCSH